MEIDPPHESDGSTNGSKESEINVVTGNHSGYGLPYAPEDFPEPGDKWGWKVGKRIGVQGHYLDRYLHLPVRLHDKYKLGSFSGTTTSRGGFASKTSVARFVVEAFPGADIKAFFASFNWKIPAEKIKGNKEIVLGHPNCNLNFDAAGCKAGNIMCSSLLESSDPSHLEMMDCDICCIEPLFCRECCCILCSVVIDSANGDNKSFIRCEARVKDGFICGHICHIECALRSYMAGTVGGFIGLDAEYYCRRCDARTDLIPHVKILLQSCESIHSGEEIQKILNLCVIILRGSTKPSAKALLHDVQSAVGKLKKDNSQEDIWRREDTSAGTTGVIMASGDNVDSQVQEDENTVQEDQIEPSDHASHDNPLPSVLSSGADPSARRNSPDDVFPRRMYLLPYKPNNHYVNFDNLKINSVIRAILQGHPIAYALGGRTGIPEVYLQQAWHSISKNERVSPHCFEIQIDQYETKLNYKRLRHILRLPEADSRPGHTSFDEYPTEEEVLAGIRALGYVDELSRVSQFEKSKLPPVWYALSSVPIDSRMENIRVDEVELRDANSSAMVLQGLRSGVDSTVVTTGMNTSSGNMFLTDFLEKMNAQMEATKNEELNRIKALLKGKGKMIEADIQVNPFDIPLRRPSGVVIRENSSQLSSQPQQLVFHALSQQTTSVNVPIPPSRGIQDVPVTELTDMLYARLLSMSPPEHHDSDLLSLLRKFQPTPAPTSAPVPNLVPDPRVTRLVNDFNSFRSEVRDNFKEIQKGMKLMTDAISMLSERMAKHTQTCQSEAGQSTKRTHDHDDPDHQGHEGENAKRQRTERASDVSNAEVQGMVSDSSERVEDVIPEDLLDHMLNEVDLTALASAINYEEPRDKSNIRLVVYDSNSAPVSVEIPQGSNVQEIKAFEEMRKFFSKTVEIDSDDDMDGKFEKFWKLKDEDQDDIIVISDSEVDNEL